MHFVRLLGRVPTSATQQSEDEQEGVQLIFYFE
jgi:hypothetical protein